MKKIYFVSLAALLLVNATPVFACGGEDEEACEEASSSESFEKTVTKEESDSLKFNDDDANKLLRRFPKKSDYLRCQSLKSNEAYKKCMNDE